MVAGFCRDEVEEVSDEVESMGCLTWGVIQKRGRMCIWLWCGLAKGNGPGGLLDWAGLGVLCLFYFWVISVKSPFDL